MDFTDTPAETEFRQTARAWIQDNAPAYLEAPLSGSGFGSTRTGDFDPIAEAKKWQKTKADAGWACIQWPKEYGGRGATPIESVIWSQEEGVYGKLSGTFIIGQGMCAPTMMAYAGEEAKLRYLPKLASGEEIWCQLFSEPHGGSDLAGLRTKAVKDGDTWVINGQKIWTSGAQHSDYGILITRTDSDVAKHRGLTMFFLDMKSDGVDIRPIKQANGDSGFNEVFFDNVRIPDAQRLGEVGDGWKVALTTLMNERLAIGGSIATGFPEIQALVSERIWCLPGWRPLNAVLWRLSTHPLPRRRSILPKPPVSLWASRVTAGQCLKRCNTERPCCTPLSRLEVLSRRSIWRSPMPRNVLRLAARLALFRR